jgi:alkaline phosphatase
VHRKWLHSLTIILYVLIFSTLATAQEKAKYVFVLIGDGMGVAQRYAAELYLAHESGAKHPEAARLVMNTFSAQGLNTTYDLSSVIPDSASAATAISTGRKTKSGVIGMDPEGKVAYETITEVAKRRGWKVGILTTVSLDHATPAAFYAHVPSRKQMYDISMQLANSGFDYFAGGPMLQHFDKKDPTNPNAIQTAKANGYTIAMGREELERLKPGTGKVIAMSNIVDDSGAMYYTLDQSGGKYHVTIAEFLAKGIELLDNPSGFFIMVEGGKIDWACHSHDGAASIHDTLALDAAVAEAMKFYRGHPNETLIVVTGDHETGGMSIGFAGSGYLAFADNIQHQKMSHIEFGKKLEEFKKSHTPVSSRFEDLLPVIKEAFGLYVLPADERAALEKAVADGKAKDASEETKRGAREAEKKLKFSMVLTDLELKSIKEAFARSVLGEKEREEDGYAHVLYGGHEPLVVQLTTVLNNKSGIGWTSFSHTGVPVQTSAIGVGAESFNGYYDQTDIHTKIMRIVGFEM